MNSQSSIEIYKDVKRIIKRVLLVSLAIISVIVLCSAIDFANDRIQQSKREAAILKIATPFTSSHIPFVYVRNDFGKESKLELWFIGDTDHHAIIRANGKLSVFTTSSDSYGGLNFYSKAGDACSYASADIKDGKVTNIICDNQYYSGG